MNKEIVLKTEKYLKSILLKLSSELDQKTIDTANHYIDHIEYEMAFEGLFIDIMELLPHADIDVKEAEKIGLLLNLNNESVFKADFWTQFQNFIHPKR